MKSDMIRARIKPELKQTAEAIFARLGLSTTQAITLFYKQVEIQHGLPFSVQLPNAITEATFKKTDAKKSMRAFKNADSLFKELGI